MEIAVALGPGVWGLLIAGVVLNTGAQLMLKAGTTALGGALIGPDGIVSSLLRIFTQPWIVAGLASYVVSFVVWIAVLAKAPVSIAYPMLSIGYIANAFAAAALFGESLNPLKLVGIGIIVLGVFVLARSAGIAG